jgi:hypothetical protein
MENRSHDLMACGIVLQPTVLLRALGGKVADVIFDILTVVTM